MLLSPRRWWAALVAHFTPAPQPPAFSARGIAGVYFDGIEKSIREDLPYFTVDAATTLNELAQAYVCMANVALDFASQTLLLKLSKGDDRVYNALVDDGSYRLDGLEWVKEAFNKRCEDFGIE